MESKYGNAQANYLTAYIRSDVLDEIAQAFAFVSYEELGEEPYRLV